MKNYDLVKIWHQTKVPVLYIQEDNKPILIKMRITVPAYVWLRLHGKINPWYNEKYNCFEVPKSWLHDVSSKIIDRYQVCYIIQSYNDNKTYGIGEYEIQETAILTYKDRKYLCRLIRQKDPEVLDDF